MLSSQAIVMTSRLSLLVLSVLSFPTLHDFVNALQHPEAHNKRMKIAVFGGSGFVGRRICRTLIHADCEVVSISKSGRPLSFYLDDSPSWSDQVQWVSHTVYSSNSSNNSALDQRLGRIDAAVSCVGNLQPTRAWKGLFGLGFDDTQLEYDNGQVNLEICKLSKRAGAQPFAYISVNYETAKALEGPIEGYLDGKRLAEHTASELFGTDNTIVLGPCLVYGGKRFPKLGAIYRSWVVDSAMTKLYVTIMDKLRNISVAPLEDWVEKMVLCSPPVRVDVVARVAAAGALGKITREIVGDRRQGFFDSNGKPVVYDNVLFVDGAEELERVNDLISREEVPIITESSITKQKGNGEPIWEGALIGKSPWLRPLPVISTFAAIFYAIATQQFVQVVNT